ncbi:MAG: hypothetical protein M3Z23_16640 [Acidobacteriota bacterium]|nr:hypothetical protein [Acidobacteriota bacterium]
MKTRLPSAAIAADPARRILYASLGSVGVVSSTDGFTTYQPISTASPATQILIAGSQLFVATAPSTDLFVAKLDARGTTEGAAPTPRPDWPPEPMAAFT